MSSPQGMPVEPRHSKFLACDLPSAVLASPAIPASPPRTLGTPVYGSLRSPRASAGSLAADSRTVAGSQPARATAPANADLRLAACQRGTVEVPRAIHDHSPRGHLGLVVKSTLESVEDFKIAVFVQRNNTPAPPIEKGGGNTVRLFSKF